MRSSRLGIIAGFVLGAGAGFVAGCQVYEVTPATPLTIGNANYTSIVISQNLKPNVMLLVDKSQSMDQPADPTVAGCHFSDGGVCGLGKQSLCDTALCPTRWSSLQGAIGGFLAQHGDVARFGLATFPTDDLCGAGVNQGGLDPGWHSALVRSDIVQSDSVADLRDAGVAIQGLLNQITSQGVTTDPNVTAGGTPTKLSIQQLGALPTLNDTTRGNYILLITDGMPNCDPDEQPGPPTCTCADHSVCQPPYDQLGCLDDTLTVSEVGSVDTTKKIGTIVVGLGQDTVQAAPTLNSMAIAGGLPRGCPDGGNAACGAGDSCNTSVSPPICQTAYYQTTSQQGLAAALTAIATRVGVTPCVYTLADRPAFPQLISVIVNGQPALPSGPDTWQYDTATNTITFVGALCAEVSQATAANPASVEIRVATLL